MIITCATHNYADPLNLMLYSVEQSNPTREIYVYCVGWSKKLLYQFTLNHPGCNFMPVILDEKQKLAIERAIAKRGRFGEILRMKARFLYEAQRQLKKQVLWVDADSVILKSVDPIMAHIAKHDFGCTVRKNQQSHGTFAAGVLGFSYTRAGNRALHTYAKIAQSCEGRFRWFQDQIALFEMYNKLHPDVYRLTELEHSLRSNLDAIVVSRRDTGITLGTMKQIVETRFGIKIK